MNNKKEKNVNNFDNNTPLESVTIGTVNQNKSSFVLIIVLFIIFVGIIYFLPEINNLYQKFIGGSATVSEGPSKKEKKEQEAEEVEQLLFDVNDSQTVNNLLFSNIKIEDSVLSFNVLNKDSKEIDLEKSGIGILR